MKNKRQKLLAYLEKLLRDSDTYYVKLGSKYFCAEDLDENFNPVKGAVVVNKKPPRQSVKLGNLRIFF